MNNTLNDAGYSLVVPALIIFLNYPLPLQGEKRGQVWNWAPETFYNKMIETKIVQNPIWAKSGHDADDARASAHAQRVCGCGNYASETFYSKMIWTKNVPHRIWTESCQLLMSSDSPAPAQRLKRACGWWVILQRRFTAKWSKQKLLPFLLLEIFFSFAFLESLWISIVLQIETAMRSSVV